jgi:polyisoprenoid-binding protein YceI
MKRILLRIVIDLCIAVAFVLCAACSPGLWGQVRPIDPVNSKLIVRVSKAGLFSAFGDDHEVAAPISEGFVDEETRRVKLVIDADRLQVLDPHLSSDKRQQVQERMLGPDVLDVVRFPRISFESTAVEQPGSGRLLVRGQLSLHGQTHAVVVTVRTDRGSYKGTCTFKQREFGITPVSVAGGTVKVKDELTIEFDVRTGSEGSVMRLH